MLVELPEILAVIGGEQDAGKGQQGAAKPGHPPAGSMPEAGPGWPTRGPGRTAAGGRPFPPAIMAFKVHCSAPTAPAADRVRIPDQMRRDKVICA